MAITATAQLIGAGLAAKAAVKAVQYASKIGRAAQKIVPKLERAAAAANCFVAGTQILMADGTSKNIEDIRVGDHVISTDPDTGDTSTQTVAQLFQHDATDLLTITVGHDSVTVTADHPFYVPGQGWTPAHALRTGDHLRTPDGTTITVTSTRAGPSVATVYNFEVTNTHTYYVHTGNTWALVHNTCLLGQAAASAERLGGRSVEGGYAFANRRAARQAASELAGDLGSGRTIIRKMDFRGGPRSWSNSKTGLEQEAQTAARAGVTTPWDTRSGMERQFLDMSMFGEAGRSFISSISIQDE